jgi:hypothetical protein
VVGAWRSLVGFNVPLIQAPDELVGASLLLTLADADGVAQTDIRACRAGSGWSESTVTWATQPPIASPCTIITVGALPAVYGWDVTAYVRGVTEGTFGNTGFHLHNIDEFTLDERAFHSRQSGAAGARPQLQLRYVPGLPGIGGGFALADPPTGDRLTISVVPQAMNLDRAIYGVEFYHREQSPRWTSADAIRAPTGWSAESFQTVCETPGDLVVSSGLRFSTTSNPSSR